MTNTINNAINNSIANQFFNTNVDAISTNNTTVTNMDNNIISAETLINNIASNQDIIQSTVSVEQTTDSVNITIAQITDIPPFPGDISFPGIPNINNINIGGYLASDNFSIPVVIQFIFVPFPNDYARMLAELILFSLRYYSYGAIINYISLQFDLAIINEKTADATPILPSKIIGISISVAGVIISTNSRDTNRVFNRGNTNVNISGVYLDEGSASGSDQKGATTVKVTILQSI